ncbi:MAG: AmmeMemoRadiSam system radical SAM enzyme [Phocaeicola sp.]|uniref:AmmeMemoRadiSam system radical SAM enzyme n=1 Tax=Phocaeicola sp. TaxID=2773926 RepID=UPI003FA0A69B
MNNDIGKEATYYHPTERGVQCDLCPNQCDLKDRQYGLCHSRVNYHGKLYSVVYGKPCAIAVDPIEKKPLLHFYPDSDCLSVACTGCNLACKNCQNWEISQADPTEIRHINASPEKIIEQCKKLQINTLAFTYTEPLTYFEYVYDTFVLAKQNNIKTVLVSAGYVNREPMKKITTVLDAANIDLKSFSDELYWKINRGHLQTVLNTLLICKEANVWLEITNLLIPNINTNETLIRNMCHWLVEYGFADFPLHFSRFFPQYQMGNTFPTPIHDMLKAKEIAEKEGMRYVYLGNVNKTDGENTYCAHCHQLLIKRKGYSIEKNIPTDKCLLCGNKIPGRF